MMLYLDIIAASMVGVFTAFVGRHAFPGFNAWCADLAFSGQYFGLIAFSSRGGKGA